MSNTDLNVKRFQTAGKTKLIKGSILAPENAGLRFVLSITNLAGKPSSPLYPIFEKKWKKVKEEACGWYATKTGAYKLGATKVTAVQSDTWVIHMLCQDADLKTDSKALVECLKKVAGDAKYEKATVHVSMTLVNEIEQLPNLLKEHVLDQGVSVYFYEE